MNLTEKEGTFGKRLLLMGWGVNIIITFLSHNGFKPGFTPSSSFCANTSRALHTAKKQKSSVYLLGEYTFSPFSFLPFSKKKKTCKRITSAFQANRLFGVMWGIVRSDVFLVIGQGHRCGLVQLLLVHGDLLRVDAHLRGQQSGLVGEVTVGVAKKKTDVLLFSPFFSFFLSVSSSLCLPGEFAGDVQERLLEVVIALGGDVVVLQVLLSVEVNIFRLHFAVLAVDFVAAEHDGDVLADAYQVFVPMWYTLVRDARCHIKHNDRCLHK